MKFRLAIALALTSTLLSAQTFTEERVTIEDDVSELVRKYVESRVDKPLFWKPCLNIGGDVRFEYNHYFESRDNLENLEGFRNLPRDAVAVNANIYLEYDTCRTWAKLQIDAVNPGGAFPRKEGRIRVKRALMGYNLYQCGCTRWYAELGRQRLGEHFESQVQYGSRLDGIFTRISAKMPRLGESYAQTAFMVLDADKSQYGVVGSIGAMDLFGQCIYVKLSLVDWTGAGSVISTPFTPFVQVLVSQAELRENAEARLKADGKEIPHTEIFTVPIEDLKGVIVQAPMWKKAMIWEALKRRDLGFAPAQLLVGKKFCDFWCCKTLKVYGAILYNLVDRERFTFGDTKEKDEYAQPVLEPIPVRGDRLAWYAGFQLGEVCGCGQWALKAVYQYVQAFSILPSDNNGIGRTNAGEDLFVGCDIGTIITVTNYKGVDCELAYAITDHITVRGQFQYASNINKNLGGPTTFARFMTRLIYAF